MAAMLPLNVLSPAEALDMALAQRVLPALLATAPLEAQMRRKRHDTRDTLGVSGTAILLPQRIQMILTHAGKPHCDCWTLRLDLPAHCVSA